MDRPTRTFRLNGGEVTTTAHLLTHKQLCALSQIEGASVVKWTGGNENVMRLLAPGGSLVIHHDAIRVEVL